VVSARTGRGALGCLVPLLLLAALAYFGANVGEVYLRYYRFRDAMQQEARFAGRRGDGEIRQRLAAVADSLGLPESAQQVRIMRTPRSISISSSYYERVELPLTVRELRLHPKAESTF